jgi:hypothetical protein
MKGGDRDIETIKLNLLFSFIISIFSSVKKVTLFIAFWQEKR